MFEKRITKELVEGVYLVVSALHENILEQSGGMQGIRDEGGLYHSLNKILLYREKHQQNPISVGAFVYEELARRHHFNDGNKRTAHAFAKVVLFLMGHHFKIVYKEAVPYIIEIAKYQSPITTENIKGWIKKRLTPVQNKNLEKYLKEVVIDIVDYASQEERKAN